MSVTDRKLDFQGSGREGFVEARGLSFAFPTQTVHLDGPVAKALAGGKAY